MLAERRLIVEEPVAKDSDTSHAGLMAAFTRALHKTARELRGEVDAVVAVSRTNKAAPIDDRANAPEQTSIPEPSN